MEANLVESAGGVGDLQPPRDQLRRTARWFFLEESAIPRPSLRCTTYASTSSAPILNIGSVDLVLAAEAEGEPALEELELLSVVVDGLI